MEENTRSSNGPTFFSLSGGDCLDQSTARWLAPSLHPVDVAKTIFRTSMLERFVEHLSSFKLTTVDGGQPPILHHKLSEELTIRGRIGSESRNGEAYELSSVHHLAMKMIPLRISSMEQYPTTAPWLEKEVLEELSLAVHHAYCPNLPLFYAAALCPKTVFNGRLMEDELIWRKTELQSSDQQIPSLLIFNELMNMDFNKFLGSAPRPEFLNIILFQVTIGLYVLHQTFGLDHNDLHPGNVLIAKLGTSRKDGVWKYILPSKSGPINFFIPQLGVLAYIWDFGSVTRMGESDLKTGNKKPNASDLLVFLSKLINSINHIAKEDQKYYLELREMLRTIDDEDMTYGDILERYFCRWFSQHDELLHGAILEEYDLTKPPSFQTRLPGIVPADRKFFKWQVSIPISL